MHHCFHFYGPECISSDVAGSVDVFVESRYWTSSFSTVNFLELRPWISFYPSVSFLKSAFEQCSFRRYRHWAVSSDKVFSTVTVVIFEFDEGHHHSHHYRPVPSKWSLLSTWWVVLIVVIVERHHCHQIIRLISIDYQRIGPIDLWDFRQIFPLSLDQFVRYCFYNIKNSRWTVPFISV